MVSDLFTTFGFFAMIATKMLSSNLCCVLPSSIYYRSPIAPAV